MHTETSRHFRFIEELIGAYQQLYIVQITHNLINPCMSHKCCLHVSDCDILRHHDSRIMTYHDCENHHDCHILQTFGTNKEAVVYKYFTNTCHCIIPMVVDVMENRSTHYKCC